MKLDVASPCGQSWERMSGDDRVRFCSACRLNVYNLSALTEAELRALVERTEGRLCGRFYQRPDGTVLTRDCPVGVRRRVIRGLALVAGLVVFAVTVGLVAGACRGGEWGDLVDRVREWFSPAPPALMGDICPPAPPTP